jgi:bromodomain-containing protein 7/9
LDPIGIFADPVTDDIAPGYSSLIRNPMDFSTIRQKLNKLEYLSLYGLREDLELMCINCTKYNTGMILKKNMLTSNESIYKDETLKS